MSHHEQPEIRIGHTILVYVKTNSSSPWCTILNMDYLQAHWFSHRHMMKVYWKTTCMVYLICCHTICTTADYVEKPAERRLDSLLSNSTLKMYQHLLQFIWSKTINILVHLGIEGTYGNMRRILYLYKNVTEI